MGDIIPHCRWLWLAALLGLTVFGATDSRAQTAAAIDHQSYRTARFSPLDAD